VGRLLVPVALLAFAAPAAAAVVRPIPRPALLAIDAKMIGRNYLPTRVTGFAYTRWSLKGSVLRVDFRSKAGIVVEWRVQPMTGSCDAGMQKSYQLSGNKVWWAQSATEQYAWRCVFDQRGQPLRLVAASTAPTTKLAAVGLGAVVASAKRY